MPSFTSPQHDPLDAGSSPGKTDLFCGACGAANPPSRCAQCGLVFYCSRDCQKAHWKDHKRVCKKARTTGTGTAGPPGGTGTSPPAGTFNKLQQMFETAYKLLEECHPAQLWVSNLDRARSMLDNECKAACQEYLNKDNIPRGLVEDSVEAVQYMTAEANVDYWQMRRCCEGLLCTPPHTYSDRHTPLHRSCLKAHEDRLEIQKAIAILKSSSLPRGDGTTNPFYKMRQVPGAERELYLILLHMAEHLSRTTVSAQRPRSVMLAETAEACACLERAVKLAETHTFELDAAFSQALNLPPGATQNDVFPTSDLTKSFLQWPQIVKALCQLSYVTMRQQGGDPLEAAEKIMQRCDEVTQKYHQMRHAQLQQAALHKNTVPPLTPKLIRKLLDNNRARIQNLRQLSTTKLRRHDNFGPVIREDQVNWWAGVLGGADGPSIGFSLNLIASLWTSFYVQEQQGFLCIERKDQSTAEKHFRLAVRIADEVLGVGSWQTRSVIYEEEILTMQKMLANFCGDMESFFKVALNKTCPGCGEAFSQNPADYKVQNSVPHELCVEERTIGVRDLFGEAALDAAITGCTIYGSCRHAMHRACYAKYHGNCCLVCGAGIGKVAT